MKKLLVFTAVVMALGSAWAQLPNHWWDAWVTIADEEFKVSEWNHLGLGDPPTYLGTLPLDGSRLQFERIEGQVWCKQVLYVDGTVQIWGDLRINGQWQDIPIWELGAGALNLHPNPLAGHTYSLLAGPSPEWGPVLHEGDEVVLGFYATAASPGGDGPLGVATYYATFDVGSAAPIPEPATLGLVGLGALVLALRRKRRL